MADFEFEQAIKDFRIRCYKEAAKIIEYGPASDRLALIKSILGTDARALSNEQDQGMIDAQAALSRVMEIQRDVRPQALAAGTDNTYEAHLSGTNAQGPVPN